VARRKPLDQELELLEARRVRGVIYAGECHLVSSITRRKTKTSATDASAPRRTGRLEKCAAKRAWDWWIRKVEQILVQQAGECVRSLRVQVVRSTASVVQGRYRIDHVGGAIEPEDAFYFTMLCVCVSELLAAVN